MGSRGGLALELALLVAFPALLFATGFFPRSDLVRLRDALRGTESS